MQSSPSRFFWAQQGFLDHRAILLAVMGLTRNAGNGICNWCLFSMHLMAGVSFGLPWLAPCPLLRGWTQAACPLALSLPPPGPGVLPGHWEVKQLGQGTVPFLLALTPGIWFKKLAFSWAGKLNAACYWLRMMKIDWAFQLCITLSVCMHKETAFMCSWSTTAWGPISGLVGHVGYTHLSAHGWDDKDTNICWVCFFFLFVFFPPSSLFTGTIWLKSPEKRDVFAGGGDGWEVSGNTRMTWTVTLWNIRQHMC